MPIDKSERWRKLETKTKEERKVVICGNWFSLGFSFYPIDAVVVKIFFKNSFRRDFLKSFEQSFRDEINQTFNHLLNRDTMFGNEHGKNPSKCDVWLLFRFFLPSKAPIFPRREIKDMVSKGRRKFLKNLNERDGRKRKPRATLAKFIPRERNLPYLLFLPSSFGGISDARGRGAADWSIDSRSRWWARESGRIRW